MQHSSGMAILSAFCLNFSFPWDTDKPPEEGDSFKAFFGTIQGVYLALLSLF